MEIDVLDLNNYTVKELYEMYLEIDTLINDLKECIKELPSKEVL